MPLPKILVVLAHPDDESLFTGGLLARHTDRGGSAAVVTATWSPDSGRAAELAEALGALGVGEPRMLGYADSRVPESAPGAARLCDAPLDGTVQQLVAHIRRFRPDVLVTHDAYGSLSGHEDHVHTHRAALLAAHASGLPDLYPETGEAWQPGALYGATHPRSAVAALRASPLAAVVEGSDRVFSVPDAQVAVTLDVRPWLELKTAAVLAHRSEVDRGAAPGLVAGLGRAERELLLGTEWFVRYEAGPTRGDRRGHRPGDAELLG